MIKGASDFVEGRTSLNVTMLPCLVAIGIVVGEIIFLISHVASSDHVFRELCNFVGGSFS